MGVLRSVEPLNFLTEFQLDLSDGNATRFQ